jgi:hypothetical protein
MIYFINKLISAQHHIRNWSKELPQSLDRDITSLLGRIKFPGAEIEGDGPSHRLKDKWRQELQEEGLKNLQVITRRLEEDLEEQIQLHELGSATTDRAIELATRLLKRKFKGRLSETDLNMDMEHIKSLIRVAQPAEMETTPGRGTEPEANRTAQDNNQNRSMDADLSLTSTGRKEGTHTSNVTEGPKGSTTTGTQLITWHVAKLRVLGESDEESEPSRVTEPVTTNRSIDAKSTVICTGGKNAGGVLDMLVEFALRLHFAVL